MFASEPRTWVLLLLSACGCTFAGLGDYDVEVCKRPLGNDVTVQQVGMVDDVGFTAASGQDVIGAVVTKGGCIQAVNGDPMLSRSCAFLADETALAPRQPRVVPLGGGYATSFVAGTAPCAQGALGFRMTAPATSGALDRPCNQSGVSLPAIAPLSDGNTVVMAWYSAALPADFDPVGDCASVVPSPIDWVTVAGAATASPRWGTEYRLTESSISVRPPALLGLPTQSQAILAAPLEGSVGVWRLSNDTAPPDPLQLPGLAGARAVSIAIAPGGARPIAVVAEIGCAPQSIELSIGSFEKGFSDAVEVAPAGTGDAVMPTIAWLEESNHWVVSWISSSGNLHVLARVFDADGRPTGPAIDTGLPARAANVTAEGGVLGFVKEKDAFVDTSLGCNL